MLLCALFSHFCWSDTKNGAGLEVPFRGKWGGLEGHRGRSSEVPLQVWIFTSVFQDKRRDIVEAEYSLENLPGSNNF